MSITIPNIVVSSRKKREKIDLSFDCSTTANIGQVQPTMAREMVPDSKLTVKVGSVMRLAPMPSPTFGRMYLKHTHVFVPYVDVCPQFNEILSGQIYKEGSSTAFVPLAPPVFDPYALAAYVIINHSNYSIYLPDNISSTVESDYACVREEGSGYLRLVSPTNATTQTNLVALLNGLRNIASNPSFGIYSAGDIFMLMRNSIGDGTPDPDDSNSCLLLDDTYFGGVPAANTLTTAEISKYSPSNPSGMLYPLQANSGWLNYVSLESADFIGTFGGCYVAFKLKPYAKQIRSIMLGLGYPFNPNISGSSDFNVLKLFAFYKAWFNVFRPKRDYAFTNTYCYQLIKESATSSSPILSFTDATWLNFIESLADTFAYLPQDYFGMSIRKPYDSQNTGISIQTYNSYSSPSTVLSPSSMYSGSLDYQNTSPNIAPVQANGTVVHHNLPIYALPFAEKLMHYANKNSVAGRSVRNILKAIYGIDLKEDVNNELVQIIGSSQTNVLIRDVMNQAETSEGVVGEYAGFGKAGDQKIKSFTFETKQFGVWLTLTYVMPVSGYYQGYMLENKQKNKLEFFNPTFDAAGYQLIERGEISTDYPVGFPNINTYIQPTLGYGFVPRYSHLKVAKNVVNGDLSIRGLRNSMSPYTLDRMFEQDGKAFSSYVDSNGNVIGSYRFKQPSFFPTTVSDVFRKVSPKSWAGNYNRIFYYTGSDFDHFIINCVFDVSCISPMKSLSDSFDTICDDETPTTEMVHA